MTDGEDPHRLAERRSLALHRAIAERLLADPTLIRIAVQRLEEWKASGTLPRYTGEWERLLTLPVDELAEAIVQDTEHATALRQATPFAGIIGPRERWAIWERVRADR